jgi:hydroxymethylpyrimidine/phosphomethylpyrimidine kinase
VMIATSGSKLIDDEAVKTLKDQLLPLATLVTPNLPEAEVLGGMKITDEESLLACGKKLVKECGSNFLIKGGHSEGEFSSDYLFFGDDVKIFKLPRLQEYRSSHGSGCSLSSAIAAGLAQGSELETAITNAKEWVYNSIRDAVKIGDKSYGMWQ